MKEKHSNIQDTIYRLLQRSQRSNGHSNAYEVLVSNNNQRTMVVPRTNNIEEFKENIEAAHNIAKDVGGTVQVEIYRGISPKAGLVSNYEITLDNTPKQNDSSANQSQIEQAVENALQKHQQGGNNGLMGNLEGVNLLFGALTGADTDTENTGNTLSGLAGLLGAVNNSRHENTLMQFEKKLSDYKQETQIHSIQKQLQDLTTERDTIKQQNQKLEKANGEYKSEVSDLETRLAGYSNTELLKRVATGVISGIGSKLLAGSPKAAELFGLTKDELQNALGIVEEETIAGHGIVPDTDVNIEELHHPQTEQQKQVFKAINDTANALKKGDIQFAYYMITIIGNCMDSEELTNSMVHHLEKEKQRLNEERDIENSTEEE